MSDTFHTTNANATQTIEKTSIRPEFNVIQKEAGVSISIDLPGVTADNLSVTTEKQQLNLSAERRCETPAEWELLNQVDRPAAYSLKLNVHSDLDLSKIKAKFRNGVLQLEIAKRAEALPTKVDIEGAD